MFGKRTTTGAPSPSPAQAAPAAAPERKASAPAAPAPPPPPVATQRRSDDYYVTKSTIFGAMIEAIDLGQLAKLDVDAAREEIRDIVGEI
ncbi:MAG TPA: CpaF family protein, partial [Beijerinckiaceae bacterium]